MGKLVQLEVNNFKSYRGHHVLLFGDSYFTSIIGPNGSGKSNSMDAISFVLGIKSSHLRSTQLKDLIYRGRVIRTTKINADGTATEARGDGDDNGDTHENGDTQTSSQRNDPHTAWVMAVFEDDADQVHRWKRTITSAGQSEYRIDNRVVSQKAYNDALEEQSILIKARNFLVFQGDVESVASQNPKELTRLIEQISGSLEYKPEYERLKEENDKAADTQTNQLVARRAINSEIKQYQEQKAEADAYEKKVAERDDAIVTHVLWKLFRFKQTMQDSHDDIAKHQEEHKEHVRGADEFRQRAEKARQAEGKVTRELNKVERDIKGKEKEIEEAENSLVPIDEKIKILNKDLGLLHSRIKNGKRERDNQNELIQRWQKDLGIVQKAEKKWETEFKAAAAQQGRDLSAQDLQEYNRLRGDVTKQTHENQVEINRLEREVITDKATVQNLKQKIETFRGHVHGFEEDLHQLQQQQKDAQAKLKELEIDRATKQKAYNKIVSDRRQVDKQKQELNENLRENLQKLYEADSGRRQTQKEIASREAVAQMKRIYTTGVHGRYQDLIRPKQRKYDTAVSTLLGWHLDAIIVDTDRTAKECIQYLKEQKIGQFTFIPLDTIAIKAVNQNLKGMHPGMRLGIDCIEYDSSLERAMAAACGNSIICDDLKIAKYLCYEKRVDAKAVTLDGTVIAKGGTMTGGSLGSNKGTRWNDQAVENLKKVIDKLKDQLAALPRSDRRSAEEETLEVDLADLGDRIRALQDESKALDRNIASKKKELQHYEQQLREWQPNYAKANDRLENHMVELKTYQEAVDEVADLVFASFCQRLGYGSIREYEAQEGNFQQEAAEKRIEFTKQRSKLESMEKFQQGLLDQANVRLKELEARVRTSEANIKGFEAEKEELQSSIDVLNAELEATQESRAALKDKHSERANVVNEARKQLDQKNELAKSVQKEIDTQKANMRRTRASRYALLRKCSMDEINVPLAEGSASLNQLRIGDITRHDPDAMDVDDDLDTTQLQQPDADDYGIEVDFEGLDDDLKEDSTSACETRLQEIITSLNGEIDKSNPNMRAGDRLNSTEAKLKESTKVWDATRKSAQKAKKDFEDVKQKRHDLFQKAFDHISENIAGTYKDLTKSAQYPLGGQAYLDMEDSNEPYLAGLKYHAMPPLKRFRDMEHLSGGEKTIAALALLFAIHSYQPSPFFVLDEVDAALDNVNVGRVAKYVREHAQPGMQFIVISLKAGFFQESESLVGVMRDQSKMSSRVVSLDLRKYQPS